MAADRFFELRLMMEEAFSDDNLDLARELAIEYLEIASSRKENWNYGNALHHSNLILGRIALKNEDLITAKKHLIIAGATPGSPQLNSFGPNMRLAKELLEKGEKETVIQYINMTKRFWWWIFSLYKTMKWKRQINKGMIPDFGGNLVY